MNSTRRVYRIGESRYNKFCAQADLPDYPASELMLFAAHLFNQQLSHGSIKSYLTAVRHAQICRDLGDPGISMMPQLEYVMKGIK